MATLPLRFKFLGQFAIGYQSYWYEGPRPKKGRELLQYLGSYPRRVATRDDLAEAIWPNIDLDMASHRIHLAASGARGYLRKILGENVITRVPGGYVWDPRVVVSSDVEALFSLCRAGTKEALEDAITLYGGPFLPGENADWQHLVRFRCSSVYVGAVVQLATIAFQAGKVSEAAAYGLQLLDTDPGHEGATRLVMQCFAASGQRTKALEQYHSLSGYLRRCLGVSPSEETNALARTISSENGEFSESSLRASPPIMINT